MQGEKEMKGKVSTPCRPSVDPVSTQCRHSAGTGGGDRHTDGLTDQATRLLEFHMLYGTKNFLKFCGTEPDPETSVR